MAALNRRTQPNPAATALAHWKIGLIDQLLGKMQPTGLGDGNGRGSEMAEKQTPQMPCTNSQTSRKNLDAAVFEPALANQA